ncbi:MAG: type II toxin-antitoxin system VapC family toxin [Nitrospirae bacterium]|nr:MAG: type II toxin-antitoxin system VapC family toxin [Nitrospirota bacterium]
MKVLLDTNICIYIIKRKPSIIINRLTEYSVGDVGLSTIIIAELEYGVSKSRDVKKNQYALDQFLAPFSIAEFDRKAAMTYGRIRAHLEQQRCPIGSMDLLIAAHARSPGVRLITNNERAFARVPGLRIETWIT